VVLSAGSLIILAVLIDLIVSLQQTGWNRTYWLILATPVGLRRLRALRGIKPSADSFSEAND